MFDKLQDYAKKSKKNNNNNLRTKTVKESSGDGFDLVQMIRTAMF